MFNELECKCEVIKNFAPSWFASVMGTGILALVSFFYSSYLPFLRVVADIIMYFNLGVFILLLIPWILRWVLFPRRAVSDLKNPVVSNFYPTVSVGMLVISANFFIIGKNIIWGGIFWSVGAFLTFVFALLVPFLVFTRDSAKLDHVNPAWFIPPVGLIVIPIPGSLFVTHLTGFSRELVFVINYLGWGSGFFLYIALLAICFYRFALHTPLPNTLAPTIWINLGPIGAGTSALIGLIGVSEFVSSKDVFFTLGFIFWGFGIWWFIMAVIMILHYIKNLRLPYAMSWWAFTFPLGAYVSASHAVSRVIGIRVIDYIGFVLYFLFVFIWFLTLVKTVVFAYKGTLFKS